MLFCVHRTDETIVIHFVRKCTCRYKHTHQHQHQQPAQHKQHNSSNMRAHVSVSVCVSPVCCFVMLISPVDQSYRPLTRKSICRSFHKLCPDPSTVAELVSGRILNVSCALDHMVLFPSRSSLSPCHTPPRCASINAATC